MLAAVGLATAPGGHGLHQRLGLVPGLAVHCQQLLQRELRVQVLVGDLVGLVLALERRVPGIQTAGRAISVRDIPPSPPLLRVFLLPNPIVLLFVSASVILKPHSSTPLQPDGAERASDPPSQTHQWFLTELSVRPGSIFAISAHRFWCMRWACGGLEGRASGNDPDVCGGHRATPLP